MIDIKKIGDFCPICDIGVLLPRSEDNFENDGVLLCTNCHWYYLDGEMHTEEDDDLLDYSDDLDDNVDDDIDYLDDI